MKDSIALLLLFAIVVPRFPKVLNQKVLKYDILRPRLFGKDDNGNLILLDQSGNDTVKIEVTRRDLVNQVKFYLHTVKNPTLNDAQQLWLNDHKTLSQSYFDSSKRSIFITHGWLHSSKSPSCGLIREAYLKHGEYNVIVVDWSNISIATFLFARKRVQIVGEYVAQMINFLVSHGMNATEVIIVGHSLGGHIAGLAANYAKSTVGYVVALDPALPLFVTTKRGQRVAKGDANFVQVIHTNAGLLGYIDPIGDVDFYPNGGHKQPGCGLDFAGICSHYRAFMYFAESINSETGFIGTKCESYSKYISGNCSGIDREIMGGPEPTTKVTGSYYLNTNKFAPYAKSSKTP